MAQYPKDFGRGPDEPADGAAGRLQNLLLWNGEENSSELVGGLKFREIFGDKEKVLGDPYPFTNVIGYCMDRLIVAAGLADALYQGLFGVPY